MKLGKNQKKWIEELRLHEKTQGKLCVEGGGFCCLGVAVNVFRDQDWEFDSAGYGCYAIPGRYLTISGNLAGDTALWHDTLNLYGPRGEFDNRIEIDDMLYDSLVEVNDNCTFAIDHDWMADFIVKHADNIFRGPA